MSEVEIASERQPEQLSAAAAAAVAAGMPEQTSRAYRGAIERYVRWANEYGFQSLPASAHSLTEYATYLAKTVGLKPGSIESARWAILKWHELAGHPTPSTAGLVAVLKGYRAALAKAGDHRAKPRKATAATRNTLAAMIGTLDTETLAGLRDRAIILVGFAVAGRRGEIAGLNIQGIEFRPGSGMKIDIYREKTRELEHPVILYRPDPALCPVRAAEALVMAMAAVGRTEGPLFVRINRHGHPAHQMTRNGQPIGDPEGRISGQTVANVIRRCAVQAGLSGQWSGHSVRRGLATSMSQAGASRKKIEQAGGWTAGSKAVDGYIDEAHEWAIDILDGVL